MSSCPSWGVLGLGWAGTGIGNGTGTGAETGAGTEIGTGVGTGAGLVPEQKQGLK